MLKSYLDCWLHVNSLSTETEQRQPVMLCVYYFLLMMLVFPSNAEGMTTSAPEPSGEERLMEELQNVQRTLNQMQNSLRQQCAETGLQTSERSTVLNDLITLRVEQELTKRELQAAKAEISELKVNLTTELRLDREHLQRVESAQQENLLGSTAATFSGTSGSTFIRWGRKNCTNNSQLVYTGAVAGGFFDHHGAGVNHLCMVMTPELSNMILPSAYTYIHGSEYQSGSPEHMNHDVPCSVCRSAFSITIMVPATITCPVGWVSQYSGYLMAGHYTHKSGSEFVCVDGDMENRIGGQWNRDGALLYFVISACGSLPCPPYAQNKVVTCVVCSM